MFLSVLGCTALVYSLETLYMNVDNKIIKGGKHAVRRNFNLALAWETLHLPYAVCLVLLGTGLGILFREIAFVPSSVGSPVLAASASAVEHFSVRTTHEAKNTAGPAFGTAARWLFSAGWGGSMLLSAALSGTHAKSPSEITKYWRLVMRAALAIGLGVGMPFSGLAAGHYLLVYPLVTLFVAIVELVLVQADVLGSSILQKKGDKGKDSSTPNSSLDDSSEEDEGTDDVEAGVDDAAPRAIAIENEMHREESRPCGVAAEVKRRMRQKGKHRMQPVSLGLPRNTM